MKVAVNYSPELAQLVKNGVVKVDRYKCPAWENIIEEAQQAGAVYVHLPLRLGSGVGDAFDTDAKALPDWDKFEQMLHDTDTPFINLHLFMNGDEMPASNAGTPQSPQIEHVIERFLYDLEPVMRRFGADKLIIENDYAFDDKRLIIPSYAEVINALVAETGVGFLLDLSHARIAADILGIAQKNLHSLFACRTY